jgi:hypothetical protein
MGRISGCFKKKWHEIPAEWAAKNGSLIFLFSFAFFWRLK